MHNQQYVAPQYGKASFNCTNCQAYSYHHWHELREKSGEFALYDFLREVPPGLPHTPRNQVNNYYTSNKLAVSTCYQCSRSAYWFEGKMIYPNDSFAPPPNPDMPKEVSEIYIEAKEISALSPRASTALLRLALERLLPKIGAKKNNIDAMIGELVSKGLPIEVEKALDSLRVIGNEAVHPGTIDIQDNADIAIALFKMLNFVVDRMITQKKAIDEIYNLIPEKKLEGITNRNERVLQKQVKE